MGFSFKKLLAGGITAAAVAATIVTTSISASNANRITVSPSKTSVNPGETVDVMVGYEPGSDGIAAFTVDLRYDSSRLEVYEPTSDELDGKYNVGTKFNYVSFNYTYGDGIVRITGYNSTNLKTKSNLALVTFKVKKDATDSFGFWIDTDTVTTIDGDGSLKDAACTVPTKTSVVKVSVKSAAAQTTTTKTTTAKTTAKAAAATTTKVVNEPAVPATTSTTPAAPAQTTTAAAPEASVQTTTAAVPETSVQTTEAASEAPVQTTTTGSETEPVPEEPVFSYKYEGTGDFEETDEANYSFRLKDFVSDFSKAYNIKISVSASAGLNGAIGFNDADGTWTSESFRFSEAGSDQWTVTNITLDENDDMIFVPIYYMANGAEFKINSITVEEYSTVDMEGDTGTNDVYQPSDETENDVNNVEDETDPSGETPDNAPETPTDDELPKGDAAPDTGGIPVAVLVALPFVMVGMAIVSVVKIRRKIK